MQIRFPTFDIAGSSPHWGDNVEACTVINAGGIIPPPIERYLIKVMRLAKKELDPVADADLLADIAMFNKQEGQHFKLHAEYLDMLAANGYPRIGEYEAAFEADLDEFLATKDLDWNLGYGEGFESSGPALASGWLDGPMQELCGDNGSEIMRLWMWHLAEEFEHRSVVHDVLFEVDRASMTDDEVAASVEGEVAAWVALGTIGGANFGWIHQRDYDPANVPVPAGYANVLAQYS